MKHTVYIDMFPVFFFFLPLLLKQCTVITIYVAFKCIRLYNLEMTKYIDKLHRRHRELELPQILVSTGILDPVPLPKL